MTDTDLKEYLDLILGTTLTLNDGTRIKPLYIDWQGLNPHQRQIAIEMIKDAATNEIRLLQDGERLRFEFNEIPEELEEILTSIGSPDNGEFDWTLLDMNMDI